MKGQTSAIVVLTVILIGLSSFLYVNHETGFKEITGKQIGASDVSISTTFPNCPNAPDGKLVITGGTTTFSQKIVECVNITVTGTGILIIDSHALVDKPINISAEKFIVLSGGVVNASGKGFIGGTTANGDGPGGGAVCFGGGCSAGGAGYGGTGGRSVFGGAFFTAAAGGISYGNPISPMQSGSGGGGSTSCSPSKGGPGGGALKINTTNMIEIDGRIFADGLIGVNSGCGAPIAFPTGGAGSGGSIWLITNFFNGTGRIQANGGDAAHTEGGAGSGGRISLWYTTANFNGNITASQGSGAVHSISYMRADHGTVYFKKTDNTVNGYFIGGFNGLIKNNAFTITGIALGSVNITVANFSITNNGILNTSFDGFKGNFTGKGAGGGPGGAPSHTKNNGAGAGYGGLGGRSVDDASQGTSYGNVSGPISKGSAGSSTGNRFSFGGNGGGIIIINATNEMNISGKLVSDGAPGFPGGYGGGAGSGGSIWLITNRLSGTGTIQANGGASSLNIGGPGGGGRIAIRYTTANFNGNITASQGGGATYSTSYMRADHGTVYFKKSDNTVNGYFIGGFGGLIRGNAFVMNGPSLGGANITVANFSVTNNGILDTSFDGFKGNYTLGAIGNGPGGGPGSGAGHGYGAGYGGSGGRSLTGGPIFGGISYGNMSSPLLKGSAGGTGVNDGMYGGNGGGIIIINATNEMNISGKLVSDGAAGMVLSAAYDGGSGSGGSIWIITRKLTGTGIVQAKGGGSPSGKGGPGSGGRISISYTTANFNGNLSTSQGGKSAKNTSYGRADHGTVYFKKSDNTVNGYFIGGFGGLIKDNAFTLSSSVFSGANITLRNFTIKSNVIMNASFDGFRGNSPSKSAGNGPGGASSHSTMAGGGGGYGGVGGLSSTSAPGGFALPNTPSKPLSKGSAGSTGNSPSANGGNGGGIIIINATNEMNISGKLVSDGASGQIVAVGGYAGGSGSGGSIWLITNRLSGAGIIQTKGGKAAKSGSYEGGPGGGGRISLWYCISNSSVSFLTQNVNKGTFTGTNTAADGTTFAKNNCANIDNDHDGFVDTVDCNDNNANIIPPSNNATINRSVTLCPGTFTMPDGIRISRSNITITCSGTVLNGTKNIFNLPRRAGITLNQTRNVTIKDCTIKNYNRAILLNSSLKSTLLRNHLTDGANTLFLINSSNSTIVNNILNASGIAIFLNSATSAKGPSRFNRIFNNTITNSTAEGISVSHISSNNTFSNNTISKSNIGMDIASSDNIVRGNSIFKSRTTGGLVGRGIILTSASEHNIIKENRISNSSVHGIIFTATSSNNTIYGNIISNSSAYGITLGTENKNNVLSNNTFTRNTIADIFSQGPVTAAKNTLIIMRGRNNLTFRKKFINVTDIDDLFVNKSIAAVNASIEKNMNISANITISTGCTPDIFFLPAFTRNASRVLSDGQICNVTTTPACTAISCNDRTLHFNVEHFSSYATSCVDVDGDGYCQDIDCNDNNATIIPPLSGATISNNTLFCSGTFNLPNGISIGASNIVVKCNNTVINGTGGGIGILIATPAKNITFMSCNVTRYDESIRLTTSSNNSILNNVLSRATVSVRFLGANNNNHNTILNNTIDDSTNSGSIALQLESCGSDNRVSDNHIIAEQFAILMTGCLRTTVSNNHLTGSPGDLVIRMLSSSNSSIYNNTITGGNKGIRVFSGSVENNISVNTISGVTTGISIESPRNNMFNNNISGIASDAISMSSSNNTLFNNTFKGNTRDIFTSSPKLNNTLMLQSGRSQLRFERKFINVTDIDNLFVNRAIVAVNSSAESVMNTSANVSFSVSSCSAGLYRSSQFRTGISDISSASPCPGSICMNKVCAHNIMNFTATEFSTIFASSSPNITTIYPNATNKTQAIQPGQNNITINSSAKSNVTFNVTAEDLDSDVLTFRWVVKFMNSIIKTFTKTFAGIANTFTGIFSFVFNQTGKYNVTVVVNDSASNDTFSFHVTVRCADRDHDGFNETSDCGPVDCNDNNYSVVPPNNNYKINRSITFCPGTYTLLSGMKVNKSSVTINCNNTFINGTLAGNGILLNRTTNVTIRNCEIQGFNHGLLMNNSENNTFFNDTVVNNTIRDIFTKDNKNNSLIVAQGHNRLVFHKKIINVTRSQDIFLANSISAVNSSAEHAMNTTANVSFLVSDCSLPLFKTSGFFRDIAQAKASTFTLCDAPDCTDKLCSHNVMNFTAAHFSTIFANSTVTVLRIFPNGTNKTETISPLDTNVTIQVFSDSNATFNVTALDVVANSITFNWSYDQAEKVKNAVNGNDFFTNLFTFHFFNVSVHNVTVLVNNSLSQSDQFTFRVNVTCRDDDGDGFNETTACGVVDCNDHNFTIRPPNSGGLLKNNTILCPGTFTIQDGIRVNRSNIVVTCNSTVLNGTGASSGISYNNVNNASVSNCRVQHYATGFLVNKSFSSTITRNNITGNTFGIRFVRSNKTDISSNFFSNNTNMVLTNDTSRNILIITNSVNVLAFKNSVINLTDVHNLFVNDSIVAVNASIEKALNTTANVSFSVLTCSVALFKSSGFHKTVASSMQNAKACTTCSNIVCRNNIMNFTTTSFSTIFASTTPNITSIAPNASDQLQEIRSNDTNVSIVVDAGVNSSFAANVQDTGSSILTFRWFVDGIQKLIQTVTGIFGLFGSIFFKVFSVIGFHNVTVVVNDSASNDTFTFKVHVNDSVKPVWNETPTNRNIVSGAALHYKINATDNIAVDDYSITDVENFTINKETGLLKNATSLSVGLYFLRISVNDTSNNMIQQGINVTVSAAPSGGKKGGGGAATVSTLPGASLGPFVYSRIVIPPGDSKDFTLERQDTVIYTIDLKESHTLRLIKINIGSVDIELTSTPIKATLAVQDPKRFDLDGDGVDDIEVTLLSKTPSLTHVRIAALKKEARVEIPQLAPTTGAAVTPPPAPTPAPSLFNKNLLTGILSFVVLLIVVFVLVGVERVVHTRKLKTSYDAQATQNIIKKVQEALTKDKRMAIHLYNDAVLAYRALPEEKKKLFEDEMKELHRILK